MTGFDGGEDERLAPVIPLFGQRAPEAASSSRSNLDTEQHNATDGPVRFVDDELAPSPRHPAYAQAKPALRPVQTPAEEPARQADSVAERERASEALVRKLRARALSVAEARQVLRGHEVSSDQVEDVIDEFLHRGYLDDRTLADALVTAGVERKGQGRVALSRALSQRGLPRDVIDEALAALPDDDAERALEFARSKARSMARLDPDTALRRLLGQLARRGYGGSVASQAARTALREAPGDNRSGVRFVESD